jgi:hypothetical protein
MKVHRNKITITKQDGTKLQEYRTHANTDEPPNVADPVLVQMKKTKETKDRTTEPQDDGTGKDKEEKEQAEEGGHGQRKGQRKQTTPRQIKMET